MFNQRMRDVVTDIASVLKGVVEQKKDIDVKINSISSPTSTSNQDKLSYVHRHSSLLNIEKFVKTWTRKTYYVNKNFKLESLNLSYINSLEPVFTDSVLDSNEFKFKIIPDVAEVLETNNIVTVFTVPFKSEYGNIITYLSERCKYAVYVNDDLKFKGSGRTDLGLDSGTTLSTLTFIVLSENISNRLKVVSETSTKTSDILQFYPTVDNTKPVDTGPRVILQTGNNTFVSNMGKSYSVNVSVSADLQQEKGLNPRNYSPEQAGSTIYLNGPHHHNAELGVGTGVLITAYSGVSGTNRNLVFTNNTDYNLILYVTTGFNNEGFVDPKLSPKPVAESFIDGNTVRIKLRPRTTYIDNSEPSKATGKYKFNKNINLYPYFTFVNEQEKPKQPDVIYGTSYTYNQIRATQNIRFFFPLGIPEGVDYDYESNPSFYRDSHNIWVTLIDEPIVLNTTIQDRYNSKGILERVLKDEFNGAIEPRIERPDDRLRFVWNVHGERTQTNREDNAAIVLSLNSALQTFKKSDFVINIHANLTGYNGVHAGQSVSSSVVRSRGNYLPGLPTQLFNEDKLLVTSQIMRHGEDGEAPVELTDTDVLEQNGNTLTINVFGVITPGLGGKGFDHSNRKYYKVKLRRSALPDSGEYKEFTMYTPYITNSGGLYLENVERASDMYFVYDEVSQSYNFNKDNFPNAVYLNKYTNEEIGVLTIYSSDTNLHNSDNILNDYIVSDSSHEYYDSIYISLLPRLAVDGIVIPNDEIVKPTQTKYTVGNFMYQVLESEEIELQNLPKTALPGFDSMKIDRPEVLPSTVSIVNHNTLNKGEF